MSVVYTTASFQCEYLLCVGERLAGHQWKEGLLSMADSVRWSYGAGLVLRLGGIARLELNYAVPVRVQPNDRSLFFCLSDCLSFSISAPSVGVIIVST